MKAAAAPTISDSVHHAGSRQRRATTDHAPGPEPQTPPAPASSAPPSYGWLIQAVSSLSGALIIGLLALLLNRPDPAPIIVHPPPTPAPTPIPTATATPAPLIVHVSGAVRNPGLVTVPADARVADALEQAGGFAPNAAVDAINQAERLWDGVQIHIPYLDDNVVILPPAGVSGGGQQATTTRSTADTGTQININTASVTELMTLPGIGPAKADDIITYRPYDSIEDLDRVPGIGPKTIEELHDRVVVQ